MRSFEHMRNANSILVLWWDKIFVQPLTCQLLYDGPKADKLATDKLPNAAKLLVEMG